MSEFEKEFYAYLGLLSVRFANMEYYLTSLLSMLLISDDDYLYPLTILENNNLNSNLDSLKKVNKIRGYEEQSISQMISEIRKVKDHRNLFIHGIWHVPKSNDGKFSVTCEKKKIKFEEDKNSRRKTWHHNSFHSYTLSEIKNKISKLDSIIRIQKRLISQIEQDKWEQKF
ncbi:MAG: hypothetical protein ABJQ37_19980 [Reichenbachiella sp.]|uniref:hypothetical protein n=1 Tax=Reichenbachiella sp. TaxID=2184521 RepID=UPI0032991F22